MEAFFVMLVPISGIAGGVFLAWSGLMARQRRREMLHTERMKALELGQPLPDIPPDDPSGDPYGNLKAAIILLFLGAAFLLGSGAAEEREMVIPALICGFLGLAFLLIHRMVPKAADRPRVPQAASKLVALPDSAVEQ